jgi:hypothetical protein
MKLNVRYLYTCLRNIRTSRQHAGQALVELALSVTVLVLLLAAAVDLGLAFKTYQTLVNATAEASSYLDVNPVVNCSDPAIPIPCLGGNPIVGANAIARSRFQREQGDAIRGIASTLDLNDDGVVDDPALLQAWVRIDPADNRQIEAVSNSLAVGSSYDPDQADEECKQRKATPQSTNPDVTSCYIVIRSQMIYRPFVLQTILGEEMTIRAISVRRVVN